MSAIDQWNRRAGLLLRTLEEPRGTKEHPLPSQLEEARTVMARWRALVATVPHRALSAAAHQGLRPGKIVTKGVEALRRGCLTLAGPTGTGKTVGCAWKAYQTQGSVLWLDAVTVADADHDQLGAWRRAIASAALVVLDDLGASTSVGKWSSAKCAAIVGPILERSRPSVICQNLDRDAFTALLDGPQRGRLASRMAMPPNVWIDVKGSDRRPSAEEPPELVGPDGELVNLPEREAQAQALLLGRTKLREAYCAHAIGEVDEIAIKGVAKGLGFARWSDVDRALVQADRRMAEVKAHVDRKLESMRRVVKSDASGRDTEQDEPDPGAEARRRVGLLDLVAYAAERQGIEEGEVLTRIGRTRRTLTVADEAALLALVR